MSSVKKTMATVCVLSLLMGGTVSLQAPRANALVGLAATGGSISVPVAIAAGATAGTGLVYGVIVDLSWGDGMLVGTAFWTVVGLLVGGIILDSDTGQIAFSTVDEEQANAMGLSETQARAFNAEIDQINAVRETIESEVAGTDIKERLSAASARWAEYGPAALSAEAWSTVQVVSDQLATGLREGLQAAR